MATLSPAAFARARDATHRAGLCVLVVEDNAADAYLICRALGDQKLVDQVVHANDGVEALQMIEDGEVAPDLAFIDLQMPRKGGLSLLSALAEREQPGFPMVVLTSSTAPVDVMRSRMRGAVRVISKPESYYDLQSRLNREIRRISASVRSS